MTSEQIAEIIARWQASTPGVWITLAGSPDPNQVYADEVIAVRDDDPETSGLDHVLTVPELDDRPADLIFAAHAHQDIPALVEEIGRLHLDLNTAIKALIEIERLCIVGKMTAGGVYGQAVRALNLLTVLNSGTARPDTRPATTTETDRHE